MMEWVGCLGRVKTAIKSGLVALLSQDLGNGGRRTRS